MIEILAEKLAEKWSSRGRFNPITASEKIAAKSPPGLDADSVRRRVLDVLLNFGVPFNRWLGLHLKKFTSETVVVESPPSVLRRNHVGTAHACAQALIGEMAAGLLVAQKYPLDDFRMIIGKLEIEYKKAGRGTLFGTAHAPENWPALENEEAWIPMTTEITDEAGHPIAVCRTSWQVKTWKRIEADKVSRAAGAP